MRYEERASMILVELEQKSSVTVEELCKKLQVSPVTVRKDLNQMDKAGLLFRTFGGAAVCNIGKERRDQMMALQSIAKCACDDIQDGESVILNAGDTTLLTARCLKQKSSLRVITNSIPIGLELSQHRGFQVIFLGGELNSSGIFTYGEDTIRQLEQYKADKLILSVNGVSCAAGLTTQHFGLQILFRKMIDRAKKTIIVADSSKIGFQSFCHVYDLAGIHKIITNRCEKTEPDLAKMERMGIEVRRC